MHNLQAAASPGSKVLPVLFLQERCLCHVWKTSLRHKAVQAKQCLTCEYELLQIDVKVPLCWSFTSFIVLTTNGGKDRHTVCPSLHDQNVHSEFSVMWQSRDMDEPLEQNGVSIIAGGWK